MNELAMMLEKQAQLDLKIIKIKKIKEPSILDKCRALIHEAIELEDELNWKFWKRPKEIDQAKVKEEAIDILHFLLSIFNQIGMDEQEIYHQYNQKYKENIKRQNNSY